MATIARLDVLLAANTAQFSAGMRGAGADVGAFSRIITGMSAALGALGISFGVTQIADWAKRVADAGDETKDAAEQLGITTEALTRMQFAAELNGSSTEALRTALGFLNKNLGQAAVEGNATSAMLDRLGIDFESLRQLSPDQQFATIADRIRLIPGAADQAAAAVAIFGRSGQNVINLLRIGSEGLTEFAKRSDEVGNTLTTLAADKLGDTSDAVKELNSAWEGLSKTLVSNVAPGLTQTTNDLTNLLAAAGKGDILGFTDALNRFNPITAASTQRTQAPKAQQPPAIDDATFEAAQQQAELANEVAKTEAALRRQITAFGMSSAELKAYELAAKGADQVTQDLIRTLGRELEAKKLSADIDTATGSLEEQIATFGKSPAEIEAYRLKIRGATEDQIAFVKSLGVELTAMQEQQAQMEESAAAQKRHIDDLKDSAAAVFESTRTPMERFQQRMEDLQNLNFFHFIDDDTFSRAIQQAQDELDRVTAPRIQDAQAFDPSSRIDVAALSGFQPDDAAERANGQKLDQINSTLSRIERNGGAGLG